jgi:hypothetical protein
VTTKAKASFAAAVKLMVFDPVAIKNKLSRALSLKVIEPLALTGNLNESVALAARDREPVADTG